MNLTISGDLTFFVRKFKTQNGERVSASCHVERAFDESGKATRRTMDIIFDRSFTPEMLSNLKEDVCYSFKLEEGWLTLHRFKKRNAEDYTYNIALYIKKGSITKATAVNVEKRNRALEEARDRKSAEKGDVANPLDGSIVADDLPF